MAYDTLVDGSQLNSDLTSIANAIRTKTGDNNQLVFPVDFVNAIGSISGGTPEVEESAVNFIDYDGTVLYSYSASEIAQLTELPENPTHEGLISQGWNSSLSAIKSYMVNNPDAILDIGQMYTTNDGYMHLYIKLVDPNSLDFFLNKACISNAEINWGDGTSTYTETVTADVISHTYAAPGVYKITIVELTDFSLIGVSSVGLNYGSFLKTPYRTDNSDKLIRVELGSNIDTIPRGLFSYARSLRSVTIPNTLYSIANYAFMDCSSLTSIMFPKYLDPNDYISIGQNAFSNCVGLEKISFSLDMFVGIYVANIFYNCHSLRRVSFPVSTRFQGGNHSNLFAYAMIVNKLIFPEGITTIPKNMFMNNNTYLRTVTIPSTVLTIEEQAFSYCSGQ